MKYLLAFISFIALLFYWGIAPLQAEAIPGAERALSSDGDGDYVQIKGTKGLIFSSLITLEAWVRTNSFPFNNVVIHKKAGDDRNNDVWFGIYERKMDITLQTNGQEREFQYDFTFEPNLWYHIAASVDTAMGTGKVFVNGKEIGSFNLSGNLTFNSNPDSWFIGVDTDGEVLNDYWDGLIDEVRIWNIARTQEEIQATKDIVLTGSEPGLVGYWRFDDEPGSGTAKDSSPNGNDGKLMGDATIVETDLALSFINIPGGGVISGRVIADANGQAVPGVLVNAINIAKGFYVAGETANDGTYQITGLPSGDYRVQADPRDLNFIREYFNDVMSAESATPVSVTEGKEIPNINFSLATGGSISGVVLAAGTNVPIAGLIVKVYDFPEGKRIIAMGKTAADGAYQIVRLPSGKYKVQAGEPDGDFVGKEFVTPVAVVQGQETSSIDFKLILNIGSISGFVTSNGIAVPRIDVEIFNQYGNHITTVQTRMDGSYRVEDLRGGEYKVFANTRDSELVSEYFDNVDFLTGWDKAHFVTVTAGQETSNINFDLAIGGTLSGKVTTDADGAPVPRVNVHLFNARDSRHLRTVQTRFSGEYRFEGLPTGDYKVQVEPGGVELLAEFYRDAVNFEKGQAVKVVIGKDTTGIDFGLATPEGQGYITEWLLLGPIETERDVTKAVYTDALKSAGGETQITPSEGDLFDTGTERLQWTVHRLSLSGDNLGEIYGHNRIATVYMAAYLKFPKAETVDLWLGSDDTVSIWLNGRNVWRNPVNRGLSFDQDRIQVDVREGWNLLLLKVSNTEGSAWAASVRFPQATILERSFTNQVSLGGGVFSMHLNPGLHILSLPLNPPVPLTARSLADKLGATLVIEYDEATQKFFAFLPNIATTDGFPIRGGFGYIVNLPAAADVTFTGLAWTNAAPPRSLSESAETQGCWAFAIGGIFASSARRDFAEPLTVTVTNQRTGASSTAVVGSSGAGRYIAAFLDLAKTDVVKVHDVIQVIIQDATGKIVAGPIRQDVQEWDIRNAFLLVHPRLGDVIPAVTRLGQNYPNPFNPETWIPYELAESADVTIRIYDVQGRLVREFAVGSKPAGVYADKAHAVHWDGVNAEGERVSSGVYFYQLDTGTHSVIRRMAVVK
jgi:hypothetical protein